MGNARRSRQTLRITSLAIAIMLGFNVLAGARAIPVHAQTRAPNEGTCEDIDREILAAPYVFQFGLSGDDLQDRFYGDGNNPADGSYNDAGYHPVHTTGYTAGKETYFATQWIQHGTAGWTSRFGLPREKFLDRYDQLKNSHMLTDISAYNTPDGSVRYIDTWVKAEPGDGFAVYIDRTLAQVNNLLNTMPAQGYIPVKIEGYQNEGRTHYATLWKYATCKTFTDAMMTGEQFQNTVNALWGRMRLVHHDTYMVDGKTYFSGIWWHQNGPPQSVRHGSHWYLFQRQLNNHWCDGYALNNFYAGEGGWVHYGGIWTYNQPIGIDEHSSLDARISKHVNCAPGRAGAAVINLTTGETSMEHADQSFGTASAIKAPILYALFRKADNEGIDLSSTFMNVGTQYGTNNDDLLVENGLYSILYLAEIMINNSHNWAANRLIDYVGMDQVNAELDALGLDRIRLQRYQSGTGAPSAHGLSGPWGDYSAGFDNTATPRQLATFYQKVYENDGLLSNARHTAFFDILSDVTKGYAPGFLGWGVDANWQNTVTIYNKAGSNDFDGAIGSWGNKPQLGDHDQATEGALFEFDDGQIVVFAMLMDEMDPEAGGDAIRCAAYEVVTEYSGLSTGDVPDPCE